jgi:tetratricopeptide (TPR) repeat protein
MAKTTPPSGASSPAARQAAQQCFVRGQEVFKKGDFDYAVKLFKDACKLAPEQLVYRQYLRISAKKKFGDNKRGSRLSSITTVGSRTGLKAAKAKKEWLRALECCEDCLSENPWDSSVLLDLAGICDELGWKEITIWCAESALERDPMDPGVNRALARLYNKHGFFTKAIDCWERVKKACPADEEADRMMKDLAASATIDRGGYEGAQSFTRAVADKAKTQELLDEAKGGTSETRFSGQIADLEQKIRAKPTEIGPYMQLSHIHRRLGKLDLAHAIMTKAKDASGGSPDTITELNEIEIDRLKAELAIGEKQAAEKPDDAEAQAKAKEANRTLNDFELREFQRRVERFPTDMGLRADLGIRLARAGRYDEAIPELQKAKNAPGRKQDATVWLGHCFRSKKNPRLAKKSFEEALAGIMPGDQKNFLDLHYCLGCVCEELGETVEAIKHFDEVAGIDYAYRDVARRLDKLSSEGTPPSSQ